MKNIERYYEARRLRDSGLTLKEVGLRMGLSGTRIREMILKLKAIEERKAYVKEHPETLPWYHSLSVKTKREIWRIERLQPDIHFGYHYESKKEDFIVWGADKLNMRYGQVIHPDDVENPHWDWGGTRKLSVEALNEIRLFLGFLAYVPPFKPPSQKEIERAIKILEASGYTIMKDK